jgi:hypothetical protein
MHPGDIPAQPIKARDQPEPSKLVVPMSTVCYSLQSGLVTSAVKRGLSLLKICDQTRHKSVEMLRVYCRDAELFNGNAAAEDAVLSP